MVWCGVVVEEEEGVGSGGWGWGEGGGGRQDSLYFRPFSFFFV